MSWATSWQNLEIRSFDQDAIKVDNAVLIELDRLKQKFNSMYSSLLILFFNNFNNKIKIKIKYTFKKAHSQYLKVH